MHHPIARPAPHTLRDTFAQHLELSSEVVDQLLALELPALVESPVFGSALASLDVEWLRHTLPAAGELLATHLPPFYTWLQEELGLERVPDSPDHTTRWVIGFLHRGESLERLVDLHRPVPPVALERAIPRLVSLFAVVEEPRTRRAWQMALAALCLVLAVGCRSTAQPGGA